MTSDDDPARRAVPNELSPTHTVETLLMQAMERGDVLLTGNGHARRWWCSIYERGTAGTPREPDRIIGQNRRKADRPHVAVFGALEDFEEQRKERRP